MAKIIEKAELPVEEAPQVEVKKTFTKWNALEEAKLVPLEITCSGYRPYHLVDSGCHTRLRLDVEQIKSHTEGHSGGFLIKTRKGDKPWPGWKKFQELGMEALDFRCEICDAVIPFHPMHILKHFRPHTGKSRRVLPGGLYNITLSVGKPVPTDGEAFEDFE